MTLYEIPLSNGNQKFNVKLGVKFYKLQLIYRLDRWYMDVMDTAENMLIAGILLADGVNMLEQYQHIVRGTLFAINERPDDLHGFFDLGTKIKLYWSDQP